MSRKNKSLNRIQKKNSFLEKIVKWGTVVLIGILPLVYFSGRAGSYVTSKEFFFIGAVDLIAIAWVWLSVRDFRYRLGKWNLLALLSLGLFLASLTVSSFLGVDPRISFYSTVESGTGMILLWHAFLFACVIASLVRVQGISFLKKFLQANLFGAVILAIATFFTNASLVDIHSKMLDSSLGGAMMGNALLAAAYLLMSVFLGIVLISLESSRAKKIGYGVAIAFLLLSPMFFLDPTIWQGTSSLAILAKKPLDTLGHARMATLSLYAGLFLSLFLWMWLGAKKKFAKLVGMLGTAAVLGFVAIVIWQGFVPGSRVNNLFLQNANERPVDWQIAIEGVKERPILGWGQDNYQIEYLKHLNPVVFDASNGGEVYAIHPHNASLEILVNGGIMALVFYILFIASIVATVIVLYRRKKISPGLAALFLGMIFAYLLQNQLVFDSVASYIVLFSVAGILAGFAASDDSERESHYEAGILAYSIAICATVILAISWIAFAYLPSRKVVEMQRVAEEPSNQRISDYDHLFRSAGSAAFKTDPEFYTLTLANSYNSQRQYFYEHPQASAVAELEVSSLLGQMDSIGDSEEKDFKFQLSGLQLQNLDMFLKQSGTADDFARAKKYFGQAEKLSPNEAQLYLAYVETMVDEQNISAAQGLIQKSLSLNSKNYEVWLNDLSFEKAYGTPEGVKNAEANLGQFPQYGNNF